MESLKFEDWGLTDYQSACSRQTELFDKTVERKRNQLPTENVLILCEHPPVITMGKSGDMNNLLLSKEMLQEKGVDFYRTDRGGDVTFHGPGQVVGYPIFNLESLNLGLKSYISLMEEAIRLSLAEYGIKGERLAGSTGVWIDADKPSLARKICAIGVKSSRYVSMHGFALNVSTDLTYFQLINPCGFVDKGVTSMEKELGERVDINKVKQSILQNFRKLFQ